MRDEDGKLLPGLSYEAIAERTGLARPVMGYVFGSTRRSKHPMLNIRTETLWSIIEVIKDELYSGRYDYPVQLRGLTIERMFLELLPFDKIKRKEAPNED